MCERVYMGERKREERQREKANPPRYTPPREKQAAPGTVAESMTSIARDNYIRTVLLVFVDLSARAR